ncbi:MAG: hypothetical protein MRY83_06765 [Flavobacteriales bacterium]|nr:hypothetical protein [Flavobacteriales bacterium]
MGKTVRGIFVISCLIWVTNLGYSAPLPVGGGGPPCFPPPCIPLELDASIIVMMILFATVLLRRKYRDSLKG